MQEAIDATDVEGARAKAFAYGEDWVEYDETLGNSEVCNFSIMETDFRITLTVNDLSDQDDLGNQLLAVLLVLHEYPPDVTPGSQPGLIRTTFMAGDDIVSTQFSVTTSVEAIANGLSGASFLEVLPN